MFVFVSIFLLLLFLFAAWRFESKCSIIFGAFLLLFVNESLRVFPAFVYSYFQTDNFYPLIVFIVSVSFLFFGGILSLVFYPIDIQSWRMRKIVPPSSNYLFYASLFLFVLMFYFSNFLYDGNSVLATGLYSFFSGNEINYHAVGDLRKGVTKGHVFGGEYRGQGLIRSFSKIVWPFLFLLSFLCLIVYRSKKWFLFFVLVSFFAFNFLAADGTRSALLNLFVLSFVGLSFIYTLKARHVLFFFLFVFTSAILLSSLSPKLGNVEESFFETAVTKITERILIGNGINDVYAIDFVDSGVVENRYGLLHLRDLKAAMPGVASEKPFAYELFIIMNPGSTKTTFSTGTYITKLYVDFNIVGTCVGFFFIGFFALFVQKVLLSLNKEIVNVVFMIFAIFLIGQLVLSGFVAFFVNFSILLFVVIYFVSFNKLFSILQSASSKQ